MRIDGFQNVPALLQSFKAGNSSGSNSDSGTEASSSVSLSSFAEVLQSLQRDSAGAEKARGSRVDQLTQQVASGSFEADVEKIAARLVDLQVLDF